MNMAFCIFSLIILVAGCSSTPKQPVSEFSEDIEKEFQNVENSVFERPFQVKYDETSDFYPQESDEKGSVVSDETLDLTRNKETITAVSNEGPVGQALALCYSSKSDEGFQLLRAQGKISPENPTFYLGH